jgi:hypothetical protein
MTDFREITHEVHFAFDSLEMSGYVAKPRALPTILFLKIASFKA